MSGEDAFGRYERQMLFCGLGRRGQERLSRSRVVQVGCGGLGSTLAQCLVRAGVKEYTIIDQDRAELSNLHRQFLFDESDVARKAGKAVAAARKLRRANSSVAVRGMAVTLSEKNVDRLLSGYDLVLDGTDNMDTRYLINEFCVKNGVPWIYGGVMGACGMTLVILPGKGPCLRCVFPDPLAARQMPTTATVGLLNTLPALVATLQATEAIKLLTHSPNLLLDFRIFDLWSGDGQSLHVKRDPACPVCAEALPYPRRRKKSA